MRDQQTKCYILTQPEWTETSLHTNSKISDMPTPQSATFDWVNRKAHTHTHHRLRIAHINANSNTNWMKRIKWKEERRKKARAANTQSVLYGENEPSTFFIGIGIVDCSLSFHKYTIFAKHLCHATRWFGRIKKNTHTNRVDCTMEKRGEQMNVSLKRLLVAVVSKLWANIHTLNWKRPNVAVFSRFVPFHDKHLP